jgi:hypothetical protein
MTTYRSAEKIDLCFAIRALIENKLCPLLDDETDEVRRMAAALSLRQLDRAGHGDTVRPSRRSAASCLSGSARSDRVRAAMTRTPSMQLLPEIFLGVLDHERLNNNSISSFDQRQRALQAHHAPLRRMWSILQTTATLGTLADQIVGKL